MKLNMWLDVPSKNREFLCHCLHYCESVLRKINRQILSGFFSLIFGISLAIVKTDDRNV